MIPKVIHYCWFGGNPLPEKDKKNIETWKKKCPDYQIIEWNESNYDVSKCKYMQDAYEKKKLGFVPDFARFDIVYQNGGFYFDTDVELVRSLDSLLENEAVMGFEKIDSINGGHGFGAAPKNETMKELRDIYFELEFVNKDGSLNLTPSPVYITEKLKEHGLILNNRLQTLDNMTVFPTDYFCPVEFETGKLQITKNTYSIHWFNASWLDDKNRKRVFAERKMKVFFGKAIGGWLAEMYWKLCRLSDLYQEKGSSAVINKILFKIFGKNNL